MKILTKKWTEWTMIDMLIMCLFGIILVPISWFSFVKGFDLLDKISTKTKDNKTEEDEEELE